MWLCHFFIIYLFFLLLDSVQKTFGWIDTSEKVTSHNNTNEREVEWGHCHGQMSSLQALARYSVLVNVICIQKN